MSLEAAGFTTFKADADKYTELHFQLAAESESTSSSSKLSLARWSHWPQSLQESWRMQMGNCNFVEAKKKKTTKKIKEKERVFIGPH